MCHRSQIGPMLWCAAILALMSFAGLTLAQDCVCPPQNSAPTVKIKYIPAKYIAPGDGKKMYAQYCAVCHGDNGDGNGKAAPALTVPASSLVNLTARNNGRFPDAGIRKVLTYSNIQAHQVQHMPNWWAQFRMLDKRHPTDADHRINSLVVYLRQIQVPGPAQAFVLN